MPRWSGLKDSHRKPPHDLDMKISAFSLLAAALLVGAPAVAQTMPNHTPNPAMRQAFQQMRSRMEGIRRAERAQVLGALTPAHRVLLANIAGELTTSVAPDYDAAAKRLDAALSPSESQAVIRAAQNARTQARSLMESMRSQFPAPPNAGGFHRAHGPNGGTWNGRNRTPDAGRMLLHLMMGGPMGMGPGMRGGPPHP